MCSTAKGSSHTKKSISKLVAELLLGSCLYSN